MPRHVVSLTVNAQGASDDFPNALANARTRLIEAANAIAQGGLPEDPGVTLDLRDPGGGGGPCVPRTISIDIVIDPSVLPEAQSNDDD